MKTMIALVVILGSLRAEAVCVVSEPCVCYPRGSAPAMPGTIVGHVVSIAGPKTEIAVDSALLAVPTGSTILVPRVDGDAVDGTWLLMFDRGAFWKRLPVSSDGNVTCMGATLSTDDARAAFAEMQCTETLEMRGFSGSCGGGRPATPSSSCSEVPVVSLALVALLLRRKVG